MLQRFSGTEGRRFVIEALETQPVVAGNALVAETLCDVSRIEGVEPGSVIMAQGDLANDICFVLSGSASISISGREVAVRDAGEHVGEMALLNPGRPRSATVTARQEVVLARTPAQAFIDLANCQPSLWRNLARSLADRLRQRSAFIQSINTTPALFIGCSVESLSIAEAIRARLGETEIEVTLWTDGVFKPSTFTLESLETQLARSDFAALVLAPDDEVTSRSQTAAAPRDNVVFELGLFMGALGHARTFVVKPRDTEVKIPSDLGGFIPLTYTLAAESDPYEALGPVCAQLVAAIVSAGPR